MSEESYKLVVENRLSTLETSMRDLKDTVVLNNKSIVSLERTVARMSVVMPLLGGLLFVVGYLIH